MSESSTNSLPESCSPLPEEIQNFVTAGLEATARLELNDGETFLTPNQDILLELEGAHGEAVFSAGWRQLVEIPKQPLVPVDFIEYRRHFEGVVSYLEHYHGLQVTAEGGVVYDYFVTASGSDIYEAETRLFKLGEVIPEPLLELARQMAGLFETVTWGDARDQNFAPDVSG